MRFQMNGRLKYRARRFQAEGVPWSSSYPVTVDLRQNSTSDRFVNTSLPSNAVIDTAMMNITIFYDMMGHSVDGLERLIVMPCGCGEQNLITVTPTIFLAKYLTSVGKFIGVNQEKSLNYMYIGYQRELTYRHPSGGFSAFGTPDSSASTWLTAFAFRSFQHASTFISIDMSTLIQDENWLVQQQLPSGQFLEPGCVIHRDMQGGADSAVTTTAYVLIALLEEGSVTSWDPTTAITFVEDRLDNMTNTGAIALVTYALHLANSTRAEAAFGKLMALAQQDGESTFWSSDNQYASRGIEATSYALLTFLHRNAVSEAFPIAQFLINKRSSLGGYSTTQDTVLALQALSEYMIRSANLDPNMTVAITADGKKTVFNINSATIGQLMKLELAFVPPSVHIEANGKGLVLVQVSSSYNIIPITKSQSNDQRQRNTSSPMSLEVITVNDTLDEINLNLCPRSTSNDTGMAIVQVEIPSGYEADKARLDAIVSARGIVGLKMAEKTGNQIVLYFDALNDSDTHCTPLRLVRTSVVLGQASVFARIVDYYAPENTEWQIVDAQSAQNASTCDVCGSQCAGCDGSIVTAVNQTFVEDAVPEVTTTATTMTTAMTTMTTTATTMTTTATTMTTAMTMTTPTTTTPITTATTMPTNTTATTTTTTTTTTPATTTTMTTTPATTTTTTTTTKPATLATTTTTTTKTITPSKPMASTTTKVATASISSTTTTKTKPVAGSATTPTPSTPGDQKATSSTPKPVAQLSTTTSAVDSNTATSSEIGNKEIWNGKSLAVSPALELATLLGSVLMFMLAT